MDLACDSPGSRVDPKDWMQEYRSLLTLEGLQALAGQCLRRLQELRSGEARPRTPTPAILCACEPAKLGPYGLASQAPLSMGFSRQEYWSGLAFPSPGVFQTQRS